MKWTLSLSAAFGAAVIAMAGPIASAAVFTDSDDRIEVARSKDPVIRRANAAVATKIARYRIESTRAGERISGPTLRETAETCPDERFSSQIAVGDCTGVLIGPDLLLTAGHCMLENWEQDECAAADWVFSYETLNSKAKTVTVPSSAVYHCAKVVAKSHVASDSALNPDYALVRIDRPVQGVEPVRLSSATLAELWDSQRRFFAITSLSGQPKKLSRGLYVPASVATPGLPARLFREEIERAGKFWMTTAFAGGSSGGPVFDEEDGSLVGIVVVGGRQEFARDEKRGCRRSVERGLPFGASIPLDALAWVQAVSAIDRP